MNQMQGQCVLLLKPDTVLTQCENVGESEDSFGRAVASLSPRPVGDNYVNVVDRSWRSGGGGRRCGGSCPWLSLWRKLAVVVVVDKGRVSVAVWSALRTGDGDGSYVIVDIVGLLHYYYCCCCC